MRATRVSPCRKKSATWRKKLPVRRCGHAPVAGRARGSGPQLLAVRHLQRTHEDVARKANGLPSNAKTLDVALDVSAPNRLAVFGVQSHDSTIVVNTTLNPCE